ncbi:MAG: molybdopterin biosynthesis protein [Pseudomonadota bacterium]
MSGKKEFKRHVYLDLKTLNEAGKIFKAAFTPPPPLGTETIPVHEALDRITAEPVFARFSCPNFHAAAMDGVAVKAEDTYGAFPDSPKTLTVGRDAFYVNTGHALPGETNAVIMIEQVEEPGPGLVRIEASAYPWQHVRKVGEDIVATEMVLPQGVRLGPYELGALAASGAYEISVKKKPRVLIIPTGSELAPPEAVRDGPLGPGRMVEFNSIILSGLVRRAGGEPVARPILLDEYDAILNALRQATEEDNDLVIINAGSSAGSEDYTASAMAELGEVLVHGVTIMPGKPTIIGVINGKPVIGNPGYPVSAVISFEQFALPFLDDLQGVRTPRRPEAVVSPSQALPSKLGLEEFLRVKLGRIRDKIVAAPLPRGAGSITTLTKADGIIRIPVDKEGVTAQESVRAELLRPLGDIEGALICIGSHDNTLDVLGDLLRRRDPGMSLSSGNVGSLGGLLTLKRGFSHLAGSHLLDVETGDYNFSYIKKHLQGFPVRLVNLVTREQGFLVKPGNPKNIRTFADLVRDDVVFVNRQAGSGTRILLDFNLKQLNLPTSEIQGYDRDEFTHMAVAAAVLSGRADVGLAVFSSAKALGLDFAPVTIERYDLVIPEEFWNDAKIQTLLAVIRSGEYKSAVEKLGGYGTEQTGELLLTWNGIG